MCQEADGLSEQEMLRAENERLRADLEEARRQLQIARRTGDDIEADLREREALYRRVIAASDAVVYQMHARSGRYTFLSEEIEHLTGYPPETFTAQTWFDMKGRTHMRGGLAGMHLGDAVALYRAGKLERWTADTVFQHRNGEWRWVSDSSVPLFDAEGAFLGSMGILQDITERKRLEEQLLQAQKMEVLGSLAGGIAHDFNNLLAVILGFSELAQQDMLPSDPLYDALVKIQRAAERGREITGRLLVFARKQTSMPERLQPGVLMKGMVPLLRSLVGEGVRLDIQAEDDVWPIQIHPGQFEQIVVNLAMNARDAMPQGGVLTIRLRNDRSASPRAEAPGIADARDYVLVTVQDTGIGMEPDVRQRLFEPFFTTKEIGKGTGLGLAIVYGVIMQSGGHVEVESSPGAGSTFSLYLPRFYGPLSEEAGVSVIGEPTGTETILLVEDEADLRTMVLAWLQRCGYTVIDAADGQDALETTTRYAGPLHLLLTDVRMPRMGGVELAQRLLAVRPDIKILFVTGYNDDSRSDADSLPRDVQVLQKPYSLSLLAHEVRRVLDSAG